MKRIILFATALLLTFAAQAQEKEEAKERRANLWGQVYDSFTKVKLKARITLMRQDSTVVDTTWSRPQKTGTRSYYDFSIPFVAGNYILKATAEGYEDLYANYELKRRRHAQDFQLPELLMKRKAWKHVELDGVVVKPTRVQVAYRGDTLVFDAQAFNLPEGSMLDALIRQLPGAELKDNGEIYVNGQKVDKLMLNGSNFFKGKNKIMLDNLPYYTVKELKVYNKMTEKSEIVGKDIEKRDFVMDVSLKRQYARGYLANTEGGVGTEDRWMARLFGLYYDDFTQLAVFGNANNVNETRKPGNDGEWSPSKASKRLVTTRQTGLHILKEDKDKKVRNDLDLTLKWDDQANEIKHLSETFATSGNIFSKQYSLSENDNFDIDLQNSLNIVGLMNSHFFMHYQKRDGLSQHTDSTYTTTLTNRTISNSMDKYETFNLNGDVNFYKIWETGDVLSISLQPGIAIAKPQVLHSISNTYYAATGENDIRNNYSDSYNKNYYGHIDIDYSYQLPDFWNVHATVGYDYHYTDTRNSKYRLDCLTNADYYTELGVLPSSREAMLQVFDMQNSKDEQNTKQSYEARLGIYRSSDKAYFRMILPFKFYKEKMDYAQATLDTTARRTYKAFEPTIYFRTYGKKRFAFSYLMRVNEQGFSDLMPVVNNSNPLAIHIGNPNLKSSKAHELNGEVSIKCDSIDLSYRVGIDAMVAHDMPGVRANYNTKTGAYTSMSDNVSKANWHAQLTAGINGSFGKNKRLRYSLDGRAKYEHSVDFDIAYDDEAVNLSKVNTILTAGTAKLTYKLGKLTVGTTGKLTSRHSTGNRENFQKLNVYDFQYGMNLIYTVPVLNVDISTDINNYSRRGYSSSNMNTDELIWNAQLSRSLLKGKLTAKLTAYDLLNNLSTVSYNVNAQGRTETWYRSVPRYFMFSLAYRFYQKPNKK